MVLALILIGGQNEGNPSLEQLTETQTLASPSASRILRDPAVLYQSGDHRVSLMTALEHLAGSGVAQLEPPEATATAETASAPAPTPEPAPKPTRAPAPEQPSQAGRSVAAVGGLISGHATSYGASYNGQPMGCGGVYSSNDITIMAVSPARYREWPCGTPVQVCGPAGCIVVIRQDACPGCYVNLVDLSEAGNAAVCGSPPHTCRVTLQLVGGP
jgi:hypothetical protein